MIKKNKWMIIINYLNKLSMMNTSNKIELLFILKLNYNFLFKSTIAHFYFSTYHLKN